MPLDPATAGTMEPVTLRVLIVEDQPVCSEPMAKLLKLRLDGTMPGVRVEVEVVTTMKAALEKAATANVTILDLWLPDSTREQTIASIRKFRPPVIITTADDDPRTHAQCITAGADHVFVKGQIWGLTSQVLDSMMKDVVQREALAA